MTEEQARDWAVQRFGEDAASKIDMPQRHGGEHLRGGLVQSGHAIIP